MNPTATTLPRSRLAPLSLFARQRFVARLAGRHLGIEYGWARLAGAIGYPWNAPVLDLWEFSLACCAGSSREHAFGGAHLQILEPMRRQGVREPEQWMAC
jgi:hypothetical protein